jgi:hypothetical protein
MNPDGHSGLPRGRQREGEMEGPSPRHRRWGSVAACKGVQAIVPRRLSRVNLTWTLTISKPELPFGIARRAPQ